MSFATPEQAESAFYQAFEHGDLEAMMRVWAAQPDVICVHPGGARLSGVAAVRRSWAAIFANQADVKIDVIARRRFHDETLAVHLVNEHISVARRGAAEPVTATNLYRREPGGWRLIAHHASVAAHAPVESAPADTILH